jgi:hypothetical protein
MRILTVRQPWAWAIIHGGKDVENRVRNIAGEYRGPVAIHAGLVFDEPDGNDWELRRAITSEDNGWPAGDSEVWASELIEENDQRFAPRGAIIGVVDLVGVYRDLAPTRTRMTSVNSCYRPGAPFGPCSPWAEPHNHHLELANPRALSTPIPYRGALGLRRLDTATIDLIQKELS